MTPLRVLVLTIFSVLSSNAQRVYCNNENPCVKTVGATYTSVNYVLFDANKVPLKVGTTVEIAIANGKGNIYIGPADQTPTTASITYYTGSCDQQDCLSKSTTYWKTTITRNTALSYNWIIAMWNKNYLSDEQWKITVNGGGGPGPTKEYIAMQDADGKMHLTED
jgi:hypothetical protein